MRVVEPSTSGGLKLSDDPSKRGPIDRSRINTTQEWELRYWSEKFGVSQADLLDAVSEVGSSPDKVANRLGNKAD